jgi:ABC-type bacteriocin/lantibiotic exporter with double-glycine peptidase domain
VVVAAALLLAVAGCYAGSARGTSPRQVGHEPGWVLAGGVHLVPQASLDDCGAAALAMMLDRWSVPVSRADILHVIKREPGHGIAMGALRDFARSRGLRAYLIRGELGDLVNELEVNRPVLVGLVQRFDDRSRSHYEIVTGVNPILRKVLLLDPARGLREDSFEGFSTEWTAAGNPTLVIVDS